MKELKDFDEFCEIKVKIAKLILEKKFQEAKKLASQFVTPVGYKLINEYNLLKKQYDKVIARKRIK